MVLKSNRLRLTAATFLVCCFAVFALFALGCGDKNVGSGGQHGIATALAVPHVTVDESGLASWAAVPDASGYVYIISDGDETSAVGMSVQLSHGQSIRVKAVGDGVKFKDSDYSAAVTFELPEEKTKIISGTTASDATVMLTTDVRAYTVTASNGAFSFTVNKTEKPISLTASKPGYFTAQADLSDEINNYALPLTGSVGSPTVGMTVEGNSFAELRCTYYSAQGGNVVLRYTDPAKDGQVFKFTVATLGAENGKLAHGAASDGTPLSVGTAGLADANMYIGISVGESVSRIFSDGSVSNMIPTAQTVPYLSMFTALSQKDDATDFALAFDGGKIHIFAKHPSERRYIYIGRKNVTLSTGSTVEIMLGGAEMFAQNIEFRNFAMESSASAFIDAATADSGLSTVNSAARRNGDGTLSAVIGDGSSSGYLYDESRAYDLDKGTLTLKTKVYSYGGLWQFHGFYIVDRDEDKHYNIGIAQGNNVWVSWSNSDRDYNGFPGRVPINKTSCPGTFGSYNAHGGWLNSNTSSMFEAELKLVLNGELADLFLDGKRIVRTDVRELFDRNDTSSGGAAGAASTEKLPSNNVYVGLYAFSDPSSYRTLFEDFTVEYDSVADIERRAEDTAWKTQIYADGAPLARDFILSGALSIDKAEVNAKTVFCFGEHCMGLAVGENGMISVACGSVTEFGATQNQTDVFDLGFGAKCEFEIIVTDDSAALFISDTLRVVYNGLQSDEPFEFYAANCDMKLSDMKTIMPDDDNYVSRMHETSDLFAENADAGFVCVAGTRREKPVVTLADNGAVTVTQSQGATLVCSVDGGEFMPYEDGITLKHGQSITVKALGDGKTVGAAQTTAVYYAFETTSDSEKVSVNNVDGKLTVKTAATARSEVFILVVAEKTDIYTWLDGGALGMAQTAADGNGEVNVEIVADIPQNGAWVFVITENASYAAEVK